MKPEVSIAIPLHNEEGNLPKLYQELKEVLDGIGLPYEIVFVNDGSTDGTGEILREIQDHDPHVVVVDLDGNFGEAAALSAGYRFSRGRWIVTMDGDGQNDPRDIPKILEKLKEGYKAVSGWRREREEPFLRRVLPSKVANWLISKVTGCRIHDTGCGLKGYRAELVRGFQIPHGFHRFLPALFGVRGPEVTEVPVRDRRRQAGKSHYGLSRTFEVLRELSTIKFVLSNPTLWEGRLHRIKKGLILSTITLGILSILNPSTALPFLILSSLSLTMSHMVLKNLKRFLRVQQQGAYRVREIRAPYPEIEEGKR